MPFFKHRPFALYCLAFCAAICCAEVLFVRLSAPLLITAGVLFCLFFGLFLVFRRRRRLAFLLRVAVCVLVAVLGLFTHYIGAYMPERALLANEGECNAVFVIEELLYESYSGRSYKARVTDVNGNKARGRVLFTCRGAEYESGDLVDCTVTFSAPEKQDNGFDMRNYLRSGGMLVCADATEDASPVFIGYKNTLRTLSVRMRGAINERIAAASEKRDGGICAALLTGDRSKLSDALRLDLTRAGIIHMLAISGMHFTALIGAIALILHYVRLPKAVRITVLFLCAAFYTAVAGFTYSVLRAAFMLFAVYGAYFLMRERDVYTSLFVSVALILTIEPTAASSVGLWLSAFATLGVIFATELTQRLQRLKKPRILSIILGTLVLPIFVSVCAQLFSLPVTYIVYGTMSPTSAIATLVCSLPVNLLLFAAVLLAVVGAPIPFMSDAVAWLCSLLADIAAYLSDRTTLYPLNYSFTPYIIAAIAVFALIAVLGTRKTRGIFITLAIAAVIAIPVCTEIYEGMREDIPTLGVESYGKNDILAVSSEDGNVIIDVTNGSGTAVSHAVGLLYDMHRTEVDALVITRLNEAAVNAVYLYGSDIRLRAVYYPAPQGEEETELAERLCENAALVRARAIEYRFGKGFDAAGIELCVHSEYAEHSQVPMRAISAEVGEWRALYVSSGITHSKHVMQIREAARKADMLMIGAAGPKNGLPLHFGAECTTILPSASVLSEVSERYGALLKKIEVYYSENRLIFDITPAD